MSYPRTLWHVGQLEPGSNLTVTGRAALPTEPQEVGLVPKASQSPLNLMDKVYSNIRKGCIATPLPHLGLSDHMSMSMFLIVRRRAHPLSKSVKIWPESGFHQLQNYFENTVWSSNTKTKRSTPYLCSPTSTSVSTTSLGTNISGCIPTRNLGWLKRYRSNVTLLLNPVVQRCQSQPEKRHQTGSQ